MQDFVYLFMANPDANNNKYYQMKDNGNDTFTVEYGREGAKPQTRTYNLSNWDKKYDEKIKKGYKDITHLKQVSTTTSTNKYKDIDDIDIGSLIDKLMSKSKMQIAHNYTIEITHVTQQQIHEAQQHIDIISQSNKQEFINKELIELFHVLPRKMKNVNDNLWDQQYPLSKIVIREQDLLDVMETQVNMGSPNIILNDSDKDKTILDFLGVTVEHITDNKTIDTIKRMMESGYSHKLKRLFSIKDEVMDDKFRQHLTTTSNHQQKLFWHGSRTENILSILHKSLMIRPSNAQKQGDAFGKGNYFASQYRKSENYTSIRNSYWSSGNDDVAYIFLFNVHIGRQHIVTYSDSSLSYDKIQQYGCDSVWAKTGGGLMNDEYIVYKSVQSTVRYLLEIT